MPGKQNLKLRMAAFNEGDAAFRRGAFYNGNPYKKGTVRYERWAAGWTAAATKVRQARQAIQEAQGGIPTLP